MIEEVVRKIEVGKIYEAKVIKIEDFGCFVQLWPGCEGMSDTLVMGGNVDEYIKIPKAGSNFIDYNFGYSVILVQLTYNGPTRVDGDFTVDFADIELEFTSVPPSN